MRQKFLRGSRGTTCTAAEFALVAAETFAARLAGRLLFAPRPFTEWLTAEPLLSEVSTMRASIHLRRWLAGRPCGTLGPATRLA